MDTICHTRVSLSGVQSIQGFLFVIPRRLLVIKLNDDLGNHDVSMLGVNQPETFWFAIQRGCSIKTFRNSVNQCKLPDISDVHSRLTEDIDLNFLCRK